MHIAALDFQTETLPNFITILVSCVYVYKVAASYNLTRDLTWMLDTMDRLRERLSRVPTSPKTPSSSHSTTPLGILLTIPPYLVPVSTQRFFDNVPHGLYSGL